MDMISLFLFPVLKSSDRTSQSFSAEPSKAKSHHQYCDERGTATSLEPIAISIG
jgi:hypothetical protein